MINITPDGFVFQITDPYARKALYAYAEAIATVDAELSNKLKRLVLEAEQDYCNSDLDAHDIDMLYSVRENLATATENARAQAQREFLDKPIEIVNEDGQIVALCVCEHSDGTPDVRTLPNGDPGYPGEPGYCFWRFATYEELHAHMQKG